jgi:hypothetical protein
MRDQTLLKIEPKTHFAQFPPDLSGLEEPLQMENLAHPQHHKKIPGKNTYTILRN